MKGVTTMEKTYLFHFYSRMIGKPRQWLFCAVMTQSKANEYICQLKKDNPTIDYFTYDRLD